MAAQAPAREVLVDHRRATFEYEILERFEAGLVLVGSEVKSIRAGKCSLAEAWAGFERDELWLREAHVAEFPQAHARNHEPLRPRKLLLHRRELEHLHEAVTRDGLTIVPLALVLREGRIKLEIGLARGKKLHDKRAGIREREHKREIDRAMRER
jgi:SsrA-binding protein